jgi:hypothetical protein
MLIPFGVLSAAGGGVVAGDYELIETSILGSAQAEVVFSSLATYASTYKHLQLRITNRQTSTGTIVSIGMRFNADTGSNYAFHRLYGRDSSVLSDAFSTQTSGFISGFPAGSETANIFGGGVVDILDAFSTTKFKTTRNLAGVASSSSREVHLMSNLWRSTSSISSITLYAQNTSLVAGSRFSLYGIRG